MLVLIALGSRLAPQSLITSSPSQTAGQATPGSVLPAADPPGLDWHPVDARSFGDGSQLMPNIFAALGTVLVVAVAMILILAVIRAARILADRERAEDPGEIVIAPRVRVADVESILDEARTQMQVDANTNRVVVWCWESMEKLATDAGVPRGPAETASEYVLGMLSAFDLPAAPARHLSQLYAQALFSGERMPRRSTDEAIAALQSLQQSLVDKDVSA